jgi:hypothetical protein
MLGRRLPNRASWTSWPLSRAVSRVVSGWLSVVVAVSSLPSSLDRGVHRVSRSLVALAFALTFGLIAAAPLSSQFAAPPEVAFSGTLEALPTTAAADADAESLCAPPAFALQCSDGIFFLTSSTLSLGDSVGQNLKLYGTQVGDCPLYDIHAVEEPPPATLEVCGTGGFGCPVRLRSGPGGLASHWLFASLSPGLVPLNPVKGSFLLGPQFFQIGSGFSSSFGDGVAFDFSVPIAPAFAGLRVYFQAARREVGITTPGDGLVTHPPLQFSNAACLDIVGFTLLCHEPDC